MSNDLMGLWSPIYSIMNTLDKRGLAPQLSATLDTMLYRYHSFGPGDLSAELRGYCDRFHALEIRVLPFLFMDVADIADWIQLFRGVRRVDITWVNLSSSPDDVEKMVRVVKATEFLKDIVVNGKVYKLASG